MVIGYNKLSSLVNAGGFAKGLQFDRTLVGASRCGDKLFASKILPR